MKKPGGGKPGAGGTRVLRTRVKKKSGLKVTRERAALVREIFGTRYHFDADELLETLKQKGIKTSRATIYRTLELLVRSGVVRRVVSRWPPSSPRCCGCSAGAPALPPTAPPISSWRPTSERARRCLNIPNGGPLL